MCTWGFIPVLEAAIFSRPVVRKTQTNAKNRTGQILPHRDIQCSLCCAEPEGHNWTRTCPGAACFFTASSDHHRAKMENSSDGRGDRVECTRQAGSPVAGEGRMPGMCRGIGRRHRASPAGLPIEQVLGEYSLS